MSTMLGVVLLIVLSLFALYVIYLLHTYPQRKLDRIGELVMRLDELVGVEIYSAWSATETAEVMQLMNELKELTDG